MREVFEAALAAEAAGVPAALVTVVATQGSTPQHSGARMLVLGDGRLVGTIGGGCVEAEMCARARLVMLRRRSELAQFDLTAEQAGEDGLVCGGRMTVFIEPVEAAPTLCIFGAGHVAQPLARMASAAGFLVEVADDRAKFASAERFPDAKRLVVAGIAEAAQQMTLGPNSFAVIVTRGHKGDGEALRAVMGKGLRFVGLLGSRVKAVHILSALRDEGVPVELLQKVHTPLGLEIGAVTPEEIAVSILSELIAVRRGIDPAESRSMKMPLPGRLGEVAGT
jgi:xanthine dehydrogenase accessory factor